MIELHNGDCLEVMKNIEEKSVDMILCDLPYGTTGCRWDSIIPFEPLWEHYQRIVKDCGVIALFSAQPFTTKLIGSNIKNYKYSWYWIKNNTTGFQFSKYQPMRKVEDINIFYNSDVGNAGHFENVRKYLTDERDKSGFSAKDFRELLGSHMAGHYFTSGKQFVLPSKSAYSKLQTTGYFQKPYAELKKLYESEKPDRIKTVYNPQGLKEYDTPKFNARKKAKEDSIVNDTLDKAHYSKFYNYPNNVLKYGYDKERLHPTQKPVPLLEYLIKTYTNEGDIVLDNCMGSGSTGVAAANTNRKFIGIEKDKVYYKIASDRIDIHLN